MNQRDNEANIVKSQSQYTENVLRTMTELSMYMVSEIWPSLYIVITAFTRGYSVLITFNLHSPGGWASWSTSQSGDQLRGLNFSHFGNTFPPKYMAPSHQLGYSGFFLHVLAKIVSSFWQWQNFENRWRFGNVIAKIQRHPFCGTVYKYIYNCSHTTESTF